MAEIKSIGWEFSIEEAHEGKYQAFVYYGTGEDEPILPYRTYMTSLKEAQKACNDWLYNIIINLNKWI